MSDDSYNLNYRPRRMGTSSIHPSFLYSCLRTQRVSENWQSAAELDKGFAVKSVDRGNRQNNIPNRGDEPRLPSGADPKCQKRSQPEGRRREDRTQEGFCFDTSAPDCHRDAALSLSVAERASSERGATYSARIWNRQLALPDWVTSDGLSSTSITHTADTRTFDRGELPIIFLPGHSNVDSLCHFGEIELS